MRAAELKADEAIALAVELEECRPTLREMIDIIFLETLRIEGSERARILFGDRAGDEPMHEQIVRIAKLRAVMKFLEACRDEPERAIAWLRKGGRR